MFEALSEKLNAVFSRLSGKGRLTEKEVDDGLREVRLALLEADVVILAGVPCDFRLDYGRHIHRHAKMVSVNLSRADLYH